MSTPESREARDEGIAQVVENTPAHYKHSFWEACHQILSRQHFLTSEDITGIIGMPPNHPHAVGGLMWGLVSGGVLEPAGDAYSKRPTSHAARLRLYRRKSNEH